jgi:LmbE family N-acetylglucosaminyl deacetylase
LCVATWRHDGHPDHDATGRAAAEATAATSARLVEYPIWAWHWATSSRDLPIARTGRLTLRAAERRAKTYAIDAFTSQLHRLGTDPADRAVLPPSVRRRFERPDETYFVDGGGP